MEPSTAVEAPQAAEKPNPMSVILAGLMLVAGTIVFLWFAPDSYQIYKALHREKIFEAVKSPFLADLIAPAITPHGEWVGTRVYTPALFAVFGFGVALIEKGQLGWSTFWIDFAITGWAIAALVGVGFVGPELGRIGKAAETYGPNSAEVGRRVKRLFTVFRFDTALLILIVIDMTAKPSF